MSETKKRWLRKLLRTLSWAAAAVVSCVGRTSPLWKNSPYS